jgi:transcriptional regulator with XRE-family HTH domain
MRQNNHTMPYADDMAGRPSNKEAPPFGKRLAAARERRGLSQQELADKLDMTRSMIAYYESRAKNPTLEFIEKAAELLKVSVTDLVGHADARASRKRPGPPPKLERQLEEIRKLPRSKQKFLTELLDSVLKHRT